MYDDEDFDCYDYYNRDVCEMEREFLEEDEGEEE